MIKQAELKQLELVKFITLKTIIDIYPHYYPKGAVDFFIEHHNESHISKDIESYQNSINELLIDRDEDAKRIAAVGTVTIHKNEICRLFVLPQYQKRGFGNQILKFAEDMILKDYKTVVLDASLPAKSIYLKRGYIIVETHSIQTYHNDYLCYDVMIKEIDK
mgnify:CR=1 FL=1